MLKLFMNKNGNATALLMFVVISLVLIFLVPAPERFEEEPQEEEDIEIEEDPLDDGEIEEDQTVVEEESVAPEAETNMAPADPVISEQPGSIQGTPAAAPVIDIPSPAALMQAQAPMVIQPNQRRILGAVPVQENLPTVAISTNQPSPVIAETEDGKKVVLMIPASIKNA